jgi:L-alanine-DL-glutamate epimerase-like enolase superfamily enzyme
MSGSIQEFRLSRFKIPSSRVLGDRAVRVESLGFCASLLSPLPPLRYLSDYFTFSLWPSLRHTAPESLLHRVARPRGGDSQSALFNLDNAIDQALWDLAAKRAGLALYRFLGGTRSSVRAYASGLCFHLDEKQLQDFYAQARSQGYRAVKVKVGHPSVEWDLRRLSIVAEAAGPDTQLMVDSNEAWTAKEALRRIRLYESAGFNIHWVEDPILRSDFSGLRYLRQAMGTTLVNSGEYLGLEAKLAMIAADAVDIVNVNDGFSDGLKVAWACAAKGIPITLGNTIMNIGAHLAAALPEVELVEDSQLDWTELLAEPIPVRDGHFELADRPGHGILLSDDALRRYRSE